MDEGISKDDDETKSIRKIRVRFSNLKSETKDPFMRFWVILSNLDKRGSMWKTRDIMLKYSWIQVLIVTPSRETFMKHWLLKV